MYLVLLADFSNTPFTKKHLRFRIKYAKPTQREIILVAKRSRILTDLLTTELE